MAPWLAALKTLLPHLSTIVATTVPVFTARKDGVTAQQIAELQDAARGHSQALVDLADKLSITVQAIEAGALAQQRELQRLRLLCLAATGAGFGALLLAVVVFFTR